MFGVATIHTRMRPSRVRHLGHAWHGEASRYTRRELISAWFFPRPLLRLSGEAACPALLFGEQIAMSSSDLEDNFVCGKPRVGTASSF